MTNNLPFLVTDELAQAALDAASAKSLVVAYRYNQGVYDVPTLEEIHAWALTVGLGTETVYRVSNWAHQTTASPSDTNPLPTAERLACALAALGDDRVDEMIARARQDYYDEYKSELATPLVQLVCDLHALGLHGMVQRVLDGEFDATREESDEWARSPEGQAVFASLLAGRTTPGGRYHD